MRAGVEHGPGGQAADPAPRRGRGRVFVPAVGLLLLLASVATPLDQAGAQVPGPRRSSGRVVGGTVAAEGQYPFMASVLFTIPTAQGTTTFQCGGTVISPSWVLTAGHCATDDNGNVVSPSAYSLRIGSNQLSSGGTTYRVSSVVRRGDFDGLFLDNDVALLRLSRPTPVAPVQVVAPTEGGLFTPGTTATTVGWGLTVPPPGQTSEDLRQVDVPLVSDSSCQASYPIGRQDPQGFPLEFHVDKMTCAGYPQGGKDSCNGDSGGPLLVHGSDSAWREVGVVSWGYLCAQANNPGVYAKLSTYSTWVADVRRFGPFESSAGYIARMFVDFAGRFPTPAETFAWTDALNKQPPSSLPISLEGSNIWQSKAWTVTRLYLAALGRQPDDGLGWWIQAAFAGDTLARTAEKFAATPEFRNKYDSLSNSAFVTAIYQNVFARQPDSGGQAYWTGRLNAGLKRSDLLIGFTESDEYRAKVHDQVQVITTYEALLRRVPSSPELTSGISLGLKGLVNQLRTSFSYANRF